MINQNVLNDLCEAAGKAGCHVRVDKLELEVWEMVIDHTRNSVLHLQRFGLCPNGSLKCFDG